MFCARCGKENREDAVFCAQCGVNLGRIPQAEALQKPLSTKMILLIVAGVSIALAVGIVTLIAVFVWVPNLSHYVVVDGQMMVGADGEPIELVQNPEAEDVAWAELEHFLAMDDTDKIPYNESTFVCTDFAETLHNNAENAGIRTGYVVLDLTQSEYGHAINVFNTTDEGLVFVDDTGTIDPNPQCSADKIVEVEVGRYYMPQSVFPHSGCGGWERLGKVTSVDICW